MKDSYCHESIHLSYHELTDSIRLGETRPNRDTSRRTQTQSVKDDLARETKDPNRSKDATLLTKVNLI